ncbi:MAG TPA: hypothetical protein VIX80_08570 [Candidatus Kapabacteria bacterium]
MRKILIACLLVLFSLSAYAQTKGKVLVISRDSSSESFRRGITSIQNALSIHYKGQIETQFGVFPDSLEKYDAIFTDLRFFQGADNGSFIVNELEKLSEYLLTVGKLYIEISDNTIYQWGQNIYEEHQQFRELTGSIRFMPTAGQIMGMYNIWGDSATFSEGLHVKRNSNPLEDLGGYMGVSGEELDPVLSTDGTYGVEMAWKHEKNNQKVVFHDPIVIEHYNTFLGYVACNYFNLCTPLSVENASVPSSFRVTNPSYIRDRNELLFTYQSPAVTKFDISVYNVLGERVYYSYDNDASSTSGEMRIRLNSGLTSGGYFLVVESREGVARKPFFVIN